MPHIYRPPNTLAEFLARDFTEVPDSCAICIHPFNTTDHRAFLTSGHPQCRHIFGQNCLIAWLVNKKTCPICRNTLYGPSADFWPPRLEQDQYEEMVREVTHKILAEVREDLAAARRDWEADRPQMGAVEREGLLIEALELLGWEYDFDGLVQSGWDEELTLEDQDGPEELQHLQLGLGQGQDEADSQDAQTWNSSPQQDQALRRRHAQSRLQQLITHSHNPQYWQAEQQRRVDEWEEWSNPGMYFCVSYGAYMTLSYSFLEIGFNWDAVLVMDFLVTIGCIFLFLGQENGSRWQRFFFFLSLIIEIKKAMLVQAVIMKPVWGMVVGSSALFVAWVRWNPDGQVTRRRILRWMAG
ncbi:hypothetical protein BU16DRAFT_543515 [Lophium mytilinum]|uniref:RING-type domain-containing protein n=1 Tax=Lophium mytilinum TaxID=390894 RepID=A0A6A6QDT0_9PEZI|nr:hypothetical protein BU16DRAFT_543515 [Lophium mytilinum]